MQMARPILDDILKNAIWKDKDEFPYDNLYADEIEKQLNYIKNKNWLVSYMPRLTKMDTTKRDEALTEICSSYFLEEQMRFLVKDLEPEGAGKKKGDFILSIDNTEIFCEVKSPGWEREIYKEQGPNSQRLHLPKYIPVEVRWGDDSEAIKYSVDKAYEKIPGNKPSLLIIVDDFWRSLFHETLFKITINRALYYEARPDPCKDPPSGYFAAKTHENLSGILFIQLQLNTSRVMYKNKLCLNEHALYQLPQIFKNKF